MVTLDKIVERVKPFDGDISRRRDYERAKQGAELIQSEQEKFKESLKAQTGYDAMNLPKGVQETEIEKADITFTITSSPTTVKPQYKTVVTQMENYVKGLNFLGEREGRAITGMIKVQGTYFIDSTCLKDTFSIFIAGVMNPDVKHTITYDSPNTPSVDAIDLSDRNSFSMTPSNFRDFVTMDSIRKNLEDFVAAYEGALTKDKHEVTPVNTRAGYKKTESTSQGIDWTYIVKTLVQVKPKESLGELDIIADPNISLAEKRRQAPLFDMLYHTANGEKKVYVSLTSIYDRIQYLKDDKTIVSNRPKIEHIDIV